MKSSSKYYLIAILILTAALRMMSLGRESLWVDEGFTFQRAHGTFSALMDEMRVETQSIAFYCIDWVWCRMFGFSEFSLRFPSVIFGILAVWAVYHIALRLFNRNVALISALLMSLNPFALFYAQDARPYSLFLFATAFSIVALLRLLEKLSFPRIIVYLLLTILALYTHPLAPLLIPIQFAMLLILRKDESYPAAKASLGKIIIIGLIAALSYIPQILLQWISIVEKVHGTGRAAWIQTPSIIAPLKTFNAYFMHYPLSIMAAIVILIGLWLGWRRKSDRRGLLVLFTLAAGFVAVPWLESLLFAPVYVDRYTIPALTAAIIMAGWSLSVFNPRLRTIALIAFFIATGYSLGMYYTRTDKDPWRATAATVRQEMHEGDAIVLIRSFTQPVFNYYFQPEPNETVFGLGYGKPSPVELDSVKRIILVKSYVEKANSEVDSLFTLIEKDRALSAVIGMTDGLRRNPGAFWMPDIQVLIYERPNQPEIGNPPPTVDTL